MEDLLPDNDVSVMGRYGQDSLIAEVRNAMYACVTFVLLIMVTSSFIHHCIGWWCDEW